MTRGTAIKKYVIPALKNTWSEKIIKEVLEALEQDKHSQKGGETIDKNNSDNRV